LSSPVTPSGIEGDDFEGRGYQLSEQMARAHQQMVIDRADEAGQN
jgi:hypothetical protein